MSKNYWSMNLPHVERRVPRRLPHVIGRTAHLSHTDWRRITMVLAKVFVGKKQIDDGIIAGLHSVDEWIRDGRLRRRRTEILIASIDQWKV